MAYHESIILRQHYMSWLDWTELAVNVVDESPDAVIVMYPFIGMAQVGPMMIFVNGNPARISLRDKNPYFSLIGQKINGEKAYIALGLDLLNDVEITITAVDESGAESPGGEGSRAHIAGSVAIDGSPAARDVIVIKDDPAGRQVVAEGVSATDGTFDISYSDWTGAVIALALDKYGSEFRSGTPLNQGSIVHPTTPNGYVYAVTVAGVTGETEPGWAVDSSVQSGGVTFDPQPYYRPVASGPIQGEIINIVTDPHWSQVVALVHFDGPSGTTQATEESGKTNITLHDGATLTAAASRFGGSSLYCNGAGSYAQLTGSDLALGMGDFTIEMMASRQGWGDHLGGELFLIDTRRGGTGQFLLDIENKTGKRLRWYVGGDRVSSAPDAIGPAWAHIAVCRAGTATTLYVDGVSVGSWANDTTNYTATEWIIGGRYGLHEGSRLSWDGHIDELRITKGVARYTENFIPPTDPFPNL